MSDRPPIYDTSPGGAVLERASLVERARAALPWLGAWILLMVVVALAFRTVKDFQFISDARFLIQDNAYIKDLKYLWPNLVNDYFWSSSGTFMPYWRPLTKLSWMLEWRWLGDWAGGYNLVSLAWHLVAASGVFFLAGWGLRLGLPLALAAGALFGLHPVTTQPVCLVMARSDLVCTAAIIWALALLWLWARRGGIGWLLLHTAAVLLALGSKEAAVVAAPLCTAAALLAMELRGKRLLALAPAWLLTAAYLAARSAALGASGGLPGLTPPQHWLAGEAMYLLNLLPFMLESSVRNLYFGEIATSESLVRSVAALIFLVGLVLLGALRKDRVVVSLVTWILLGTAVVLMPASIIVSNSEGKIPMADRWLYLALPAAALLWPWLIKQVDRKALHLVFAGATALWAAGTVYIAPEAHAYYSDEPHQLDWEDRVYEQVPGQYITKQDRCRKMGRELIRLQLKGDVARLSGLWRQNEGLCGFSAERALGVTSALVKAGRFREAEPLARQLIRQGGGTDRRRATAAHYLGGVIALKLEQPERAVALLERALVLGMQGCLVHRHLGEAAARLKRFDRAALAAEKLHACSGARTPAVLFLAADMWLSAGKPDQARRLLPHLKSLLPMAPPDRKRLDSLQARLDAMP